MLSILFLFIKSQNQVLLLNSYLNRFLLFLLEVSKSVKCITVWSCVDNTILPVQLFLSGFFLEFILCFRFILALTQAILAIAWKFCFAAETVLYLP